MGVDPSDLEEGQRFTIGLISTNRCSEMTPAEVGIEIKRRAGGEPADVSIDMDVFGRGNAPGTKTPNASELSRRDPPRSIRFPPGPNFIVCNVVKVSPSYDLAEIVAIAAAHVV